MDWLWDLGSSYFARSNSSATSLGALAQNNNGTSALVNLDFDLIQ
jgi:hypothetical protein